MPASFDGKRRRSQSIVLLLSGALAATMGPAGCSLVDEDPEPPAPPPGTTVLNPDQLKDGEEQANNSYVPGVGYYHSYSHGWYPYPFNWFHPARGYYYGGAWHGSQFNGGVPASSRPSVTAYSTAREAMRSGTVMPRTSGGSSSPSKGGVIRGIFSAPHSGGGHTGVS